MRAVGTLAFGVRAPLIKKGDDLASIVINSTTQSLAQKNLTFQDKDIVAITESLLARSQNNFVDLATVARDIRAKFSSSPDSAPLVPALGVVFPIFSRNRFSLILKAIALSAQKVHLVLNTSHDEVGNPVVNPYTGIDIEEYYLGLSDNISITFSDDPTSVLQFTKNVLVADIHTRHITKLTLEDAGADRVLTLADIMTAPLDGSGYNDQYGLLGSNYSTADVLKLFPIHGQEFVDHIQTQLLAQTGKNLEVMIYGDGAFKDPVAGIWELADPVVSPAFTAGLRGTPHELKLKFLVDSHLSDAAIIAKIKDKDADIKKHASLGTTPRQIPDLVGSLCDLVSGSGDKGTPIVYIQGYFDNLSSE